MFNLFKKREPMFTQEDIRRKEDDAQVGNWFKTFKMSGGMGMFKEHIFKKLKKHTEELFANGIDPEDKTSILAAQIRWKVSDEIEKMVDSYITQGELAQDVLKHLDEGLPKEDD